MIQTVIFDLDGTLLDSMPMWRSIGFKYLKSQGINPNEDIDRKLFVMTLEESASFLQYEFGLNKSVEDIIGEMSEQIYNYYANEVQVKGEIVGVLDLLKQEGIPMAVATASQQNLTLAGLRTTGLRDYFSAIWTVHDVGIGKHEPAVFLAAAKDLDADPERSIVVEDALHAAKSAKDAGFITVGVYDEGNRYFEDELRDLSDLYLEDYQDPEKIIEAFRKL